MKIGPALCKLAGGVVLILAFGLSVYRAYTQPIAHDEALAWERYIDNGIYRLLNFDTNNHLLFSAPAKITTAVFGLRESTLRFPSLVGALAYLILCYFLVRRLV